MQKIKNTIFLLAILSVFGCKETNKPTNTETPVTTTQSKSDTLQVNNNVNVVLPEVDETGEEYNPYSDYYVIANEVNVRSQPNINSDILKKLHFGDKVWSTYIEEDAQYKKVYLEKPIVGKPEPTPYYMIGNTLVGIYNFNDYRESFSLEPFSKLHTVVKREILKNRYANNVAYTLTQNKERAKDVIAYGDFDDDGITDVAILIDNVERQSSRLLILCTNSATNEPYLAFAETYVDKLRIKSFKKGAKIFLEEDVLVPSPIDGIIIKGDGSKAAIIYDKNTQKYKTYGQFRNGDNF